MGKKLVHSGYNFVVCNVFILIFATGQASAFAQTVPFDTIEDAIREGATHKLVKHFNPFVDVIIDGKKKTYNKAQAETVLRQFFHQHAVLSFSFVHRGKSTKGGQYAIGHYKSNDASYSVLVKTRKIKAIPLIYMISFIAG